MVCNMTKSSFFPYLKWEMVIWGVNPHTTSNVLKIHEFIYWYLKKKERNLTGDVIFGGMLGKELIYSENKEKEASILFRLSVQIIP